MTALLMLDLLVPVVSGILLVHLLWRSRRFSDLLFKLFLGTGIGLGLSSLLYFVYLLRFAGQGWFIVVQLILLALLLVTTALRERRAGMDWPRLPSFPRLRSAHAILAIVGLVVFLVSLMSTTSYLLRRRQGDWDAWMTYTRAARFVYVDQTHWLQSFSAQMGPIFHADYPLLLAMNIASTWDTLGTDSHYVPMAQSALFTIACLGLVVTALGSAKSLGQAALGLIILWGTPELVNQGAGQVADVPLAFFIAATGIAIYLYFLRPSPGLLIIAGLSTGLAAWTKNEGSLFVIGGIASLVVAFAGPQRLRALLRYLAGLAFPLAVVLYFKLGLAPPSDVLSSGLARSIQQIQDPARHIEIIKDVAGTLVGFGSWGIAFLPVGILVVLALYFLVFRRPIPGELRPAYTAAIVLIGVQAAGYYGIFLITPYDLAWHLSFSSTRLILQLYPLITFLILAATAAPEAIFAPGTADHQGAQHAAGD